MKFSGRIRSGCLRAYAVILLAFATPLAVGGVTLVRLGGSCYFMFAGILIAVCGILIWRRRIEGAWLYGGVFLLSTIWALWEVGFEGWALSSRLAGLAALGLPLCLLPIRQGLCSAGGEASRRRGNPRPWMAWTSIAVAVAVGALLHTLGPHRSPDPLYRAGMGAAPAEATLLAATTEPGDWPQYGNDPGGTRFSFLTQIAARNVDRLRLAWTYRTGDLDNSLETTPLKVGDSVYFCTGANDVIALDAETGTQRWRFNSHAAAPAAPHRVCRGVAYYRVPRGQGACAERIITNTIDARLIALDAHDGRLCQGFGIAGQVSLLTGMGDWQGRVMPGYYYVTSAPTIVKGKVILGGWVSDAQYWGEPSGVIRAFDAVTGQFAWAFDMGRPEHHGEPPAGEQYTPSTPNAWAPMSADEALGLVYAPTGNTSGSDYYGALRRPFDDEYSSSVVAIDAATGTVRWSFQTVHHDLWDYDVAPQPVVVDIPRQGGVVHALIQAAKQGEIFVLDRETGIPVFQVTEQTAPTHGALADERVARTQPYSLDLPSFRGPDLSEADIWGITPLDQLECRIRFRRARYQGMYTAPGTTPFIQYPGILGGLEWGSV